MLHASLRGQVTTASNTTRRVGVWVHVPDALRHLSEKKARPSAARKMLVLRVGNCVFVVVNTRSTCQPQELGGGTIDEVCACAVPTSPAAVGDNVTAVAARQSNSVRERRCTAVTLGHSA